MTHLYRRPPFLVGSFSNSAGSTSSTLAKFADNLQAGIEGALLKLTEVAPTHLRLVCKLVLRKPLLVAKPAQVEGERVPQVHAGSERTCSRFAPRYTEQKGYPPMMIHKVQTGLILLTVFVASRGLACPEANAQDLTPAIHYATQTPADARFELVQSALTARLTLLVDRYSGIAFQLVKSRSDELLWQEIPRADTVKLSDEAHVNFQVFTSGLTVGDTFLLNNRTGEIWKLVKNKQNDLVWDAMHRTDDTATASDGPWNSYKTVPGTKGAPPASTARFK